VLASEKCFDSTPDPICSRQPNFGVLLVAPLVAAGGVLTWLALKPTRNDVQEVIDAWNGRHRDQLFTYVR
jgi:hypothetical protein